MESVDALLRGFAVALFAIYALMAIPFRSYSQPLIVMTAIPFGIVGAIWGHIFLGLRCQHAVAVRHRRAGRHRR